MEKEIYRQVPHYFVVFSLRAYDVLFRKKKKNFAPYLSSGHKS